MQAMQIHLKKEQMKNDFKKQARAPIKEPETEDIKSKNKGKNLNSLIQTWEKPQEQSEAPKPRPQPVAPPKQFEAPAALQSAP